MKKYISPFLSALLVFYPIFGNAEGEKKIAKSEKKDGENKDMPKPKNIDKQYGQEGTLNESKSALISVDPLALQNYSQISNNFDFSTYDKVTLKSVILETLSHSNDLKSANEKVIQTELAYKEAYAGYLPTIDFQYSVKKVHNLETGDDSIDTATHKDFNEENYKFTIRQSLYTGGATEFKVKSLKSKLEEAKRKYTIVLEEEIQKAIKAYFDVLFNHKSVIVNERNMEKLNKILEITQIKYDSGALSIGDLSAVKANIANASGKLIRVKSDLADAIDFYLYTVGEDFVKTAPYEENFPIKLTTLEALYEDILENNLNLVNYRLNIQSTKDKLLNMKASFKPKVDLELNYKNVLDKEDFTTNEETYDAKVTLNYNLYNGGKDTIATMQVFSSLQELNFRYKEEIKKLKWEISKLYNSIKSLEDTLSNTKKEVAASAEMVNSYWESFQLGEQDLQVLLQGQRQLNGAELDLIKYEQDHLTNVFKLLTSKGELSKYFSIDGGHPDFIDFSNTTGIKPAPKIDLTTTKKEDVNATVTSLETNTTDINTTTEEISSTDLNTTIDKYLEVVKEAGFDDIINFKDKFLEADDENYTVMISDFTNHYDAYTFAKKNRLLNQAFSYEYFNKNGDFEVNNSKTKVIEVKTNIAYGIHTSELEAQTAINNIFDKGNKVYKVVKIKELKELYNQYIDGLEAKVDPFVIKPKIIKTFMTNPEFKNRFLSAPRDYYSINVVSLSQIEQAQSLIKGENIEKDSFVFRYGRNGMWVKIMFGVFATYEQAMAELSKHPEMIKKYRPVIEKIGQKQDLYNTYKEFNPLPQWYLDEQKEKKEVKVSPKTEEKKANTKNEVIASISDITVDEPLQLDAKKAIEPKVIETTGSEIKQALPQKISLEEEPKVNSADLVQSETDKSQINEKTTTETPQQEVKKGESLTTNEVAPSNEETKTPIREPLVMKSVEEKELQKEEVKTPITASEPPKIDLNEGDTKVVAIPVPVVLPVVTTPTTVSLSIESDAIHPIDVATVENKEVPVTDKITATSTAQELQTLGKSVPFEEAFRNASKEYYTIQLGTIPDNQRDDFVKQFVPDNQFVEFSKKGKTQIYYGIFENIEKAREYKFTLDPKLIDSVKLYKIGRIEHNKTILQKQIKIEPLEIPTTEKLILEEKEIEKSEFKKEDYTSFKEAFKNAPKEYYTIELGNIPTNQKDSFIKRFILDTQFVEFSQKGQTQIYYGIFENIEKAREQKMNLHPKLVDSVKLYKIGRIAK